MGEKKPISFDQILKTGLFISNSYSRGTLRNLFRPSQPSKFILPNVGMIMYKALWFRYLLLLKSKGFDIEDEENIHQIFFNPVKEGGSNYKYSMLYFMMKAYEVTRDEYTLVGTIWSRKWLFSQETIKENRKQSLLLKFTDKLTNPDYKLEVSDLLSLFDLSLISKLNSKFADKNTDLEREIEKFIGRIQVSYEDNKDFDAIEEFVKFVSDLVYLIYTPEEISSKHYLVIHPNLNFIINNINFKNDEYLYLIRKERLFEINFTNDDFDMFLKLLSTADSGRKIIGMWVLFDILRIKNKKLFAELLKEPYENLLRVSEIYSTLKNKSEFNQNI